MTTETPATVEAPEDLLQDLPLAFGPLAFHHATPPERAFFSPEA